MVFENNIVRARTIEDAWREIMWCCVRKGYDYPVRGGSYKGQTRRQLDYAVIIIEEPWTRPLAVRTPENCGIPAPTSEEKIEAYFLNYLVGMEKAENEDYTYGQFIMHQVERAARILNEAEGFTNQAAITVGDPNSIFLDDPPCLRIITFKNVGGKLQMSLFFRSWDLFAGLPENLGGLQLLKEYLLTMLEFPIEDGPIVAYSDGLHIYEQYFSLVNILNVDKI